MLCDGLEELGEQAFQDSGLRSVVIPNSVKRLQPMTFYNCDGLSQVHLPSQLVEIGKSCFERTGLREISIPSGVKHIRTRAFYGCVRLRSISFAGDNLRGLAERHAFDRTPVESGGLCAPAVADAGNEAPAQEQVFELIDL